MLNQLLPPNVSKQFSNLKAMLPIPAIAGLVVYIVTLVVTFSLIEPTHSYYYPYYPGAKYSVGEAMGDFGAYIILLFLSFCSATFITGLTVAIVTNNYDGTFCHAFAQTLAITGMLVLGGILILLFSILYNTIYLPEKVAGLLKHSVDFLCFLLPCHLVFILAGTLVGYSLTHWRSTHKG